MVPDPASKSTDNQDGHAKEIAPGSQPPTSVAGPSQLHPQQNVVYLTADSEEELTELKPEEVYIIGGICDHNRYKVNTSVLFFAF